MKGSSLKVAFYILAYSSCLLLSGYAADPAPEILKSVQQYGDDNEIQLRIVTIPKARNRGFELVDVANRENGHISQQFDRERHELIVNGGYFDPEFLPVGLCKTNGKILTDQPAPKLSGYVVINDQGAIDLLWKQREQAKQFPTVLQSGPYLVDPGGKIGIRTKSGKTAARTVLAIDSDDNLLIMITNQVELYQLSRILVRNFPEIDRALNLDGGPSTGLLFQKTEIENGAPVRNFIRLKRQ